MRRGISDAMCRSNNASTAGLTKSCAVIKRALRRPHQVTSCHQNTVADTRDCSVFPREMEEFQSGPSSRSRTAAATRIFSEARTPPGCCVVFHQYIVGLLQHLATAYVRRCCCPLPGDYGTKADIKHEPPTPFAGNIVSRELPTSFAGNIMYHGLQQGNINTGHHRNSSIL